MRKEQWLELLDGSWWETEEAVEDLRCFSRSLKWHGLYELYLLRTWEEAQYEITVDEMIGYLKSCNRKRLRAAGEPIPAKGKTVTLYRGVSGDGIAKGVSWTADLNIACVFAMHYSSSGYQRNEETRRWSANPSVYTVTVPVKDVLCYTNRRGEREYLLDPTNLTPELIPLEEREMHTRKMTWNWNDHFILQERFVNTEAFLRTMGVGA